jgi:hypothetical protein
MAKAMALFLNLFRGGTNILFPFFNIGICLKARHFANTFKNISLSRLIYSNYCPVLNIRKKGALEELRLCYS